MFDSRTVNARQTRQAAGQSSGTSPLLLENISGTSCAAPYINILYPRANRKITLYLSP